MADAILSSVIGRIKTISEEQKRRKLILVRGVGEDVVGHLSAELGIIRSVLGDAERRADRDLSVRDWARRLEAACYEMDDVVDKWFVALRKLDTSHSAAAAPDPKQVCSFIPSVLFSCLCFKKVVGRPDIAHRIRKVKAQLDRILEEKNRYSLVPKDQDDQPPTTTTTDRFGGYRHGQWNSLVAVENIYGRDHEKEILVRKIMGEGGSKEESGIRVISIVGPGGIGKTTLARLVYIDPRVQNGFPLRIWIRVPSNSFNLAQFAKEIVRRVVGYEPDTHQLELLLEHLRDSILGKKFLLVLDDFWKEDFSMWELLKSCLKYGGAGSRILVTTRSKWVAIMMGTMEGEMLHLQVLSEESCWLLLRCIALSGKSNDECEKFKDIGMKMMVKCRGLPLITNILGSFLQFKTRLEDWEDALKSDVWKLEKAEEEFFPHLKLSYNELPPAVQGCFSYCAILPIDYEIDVENLIRKWMALGYLGSDESDCDLERRGRDYFDNLAMRSLFQDFKKDENDIHVISCKMHDIIHDFARCLSLKDTISSRGEARMMKRCETCSPLLVHHVEEYRSLFCDKEQPLYPCDCLTCLRVLSLAKCSLESIPKKIEKLIHLRYLDLSDNGELSVEDLKTICKLYNLQTLLLSRCYINEIPMEIGRLIDLRHLDLSDNSNLKELPKSVSTLHDLRSLDVSGCKNLCQLPDGIHELKNLKVKGFQPWTDLELNIRSRMNNKNDVEVVKGEHWGEYLKRARHIEKLIILFTMVEDIDINNSLWMEAIEALELHCELRHLQICFYAGSGLPNWINSSLTHIELHDFNHLPSLPPFGKLRFLKELTVYAIGGLDSIRCDFLGIERGAQDDQMEIGSSSSSSVGFPKLKKLTFTKCKFLESWEDITAEEEGSISVCVMPCLLELNITCCPRITKLPHRLLRKASCLNKMDIRGSMKLRRNYTKQVEPPEGSEQVEHSEQLWKHIPHIHQVRTEW